MAHGALINSSSYRSMLVQFYTDEMVNYSANANLVFYKLELRLNTNLPFLESFWSCAMTTTQATQKLAFAERNNGKDAFSWIYLLSSAAAKAASQRITTPVAP
jgi:hypothetical protein